MVALVMSEFEFNVKYYLLCRRLENLSGAAHDASHASQ